MSPAYEDAAICGAEEDTMLNGLVLAGCIVLVRGCLVQSFYSESFCCYESYPLYVSLWQ
jgi:hypothetical protein